jgi:hypothetical protein
MAEAMVDAELPLDFQVVEVPESEGKVEDPSRTVAGLTPEQYPDVFDRIRAGFKLEDVDSRQIDVQLAFFANNPQYLERVFGRAVPYLHHIVQEIEKRGDYVFMSISRPAGRDTELLQSAGGSFRIKLNEPFYVGLGVCAHDNSVLEKAVFSKVELKQSPQRLLESTLETVAISSKDRRVVYTKQAHFEAPNWSRDGSPLIYNSGGKLYRIAPTGGTPVVIDTGERTRCNNDHGISTDGKTLVISDQSENGKSLIYTLPISGGTPRRITPIGPSYWHGWSPDGATLVYCAERNGEYDVYSIPALGGAEKRLTTAKGLDDGPEYTADGAFIYFNSDRTGAMHVWRMKPDGTQQEQLTKDECNNWFPHPSPDGKWVVFLSYDKDVTGHPANKAVKLRLMPLGGGPIQELVRLFGGQGTINVASWSPDSRQIAFVSYELLVP